MKALIAGTFDPITNGHLDLITRTSQIFPQVLVAVANNPNKNTWLSLDERLNLTRASLAYLANVEVIAFSGLLVDLIPTHQIHVIVRGVRNSVDYEYETQLATANRKLSQNSNANGVESLFLPSSNQWQFLSSSMVKEIYHHQGNIYSLVPAVVLNYLRQR